MGVDGERARCRDTPWCQFQMPVALQCTFGEADGFSDQAFVEAFGDGVAECFEAECAAIDGAEAIVACFDVWLADHVAERCGKECDLCFIHSSGQCCCKNNMDG